MARERLDKLLVARGLAPSRARAQALIAAGHVEVEGTQVDKPSDLVAEDAAIMLRETLRYVSRGGEKLAGALVDLQLSLADLVIADIGASTGGFSDCALSEGARRVYAVDVGEGQLHARLREDARVISLERVNARTMTEASLPERVDLVLVDASFIGLGKLLPALCTLLVPGGRLLCLVKPQFEVGPEHVGKRGVVKDDVQRARAVDQVSETARALGLHKLGQAECRVPGPEGNREIFVLFGLP
ncbi:MAG TPA: TlyA family RNA methyltransferase [Polyangiaceae bacterium]|nr:TlyA family RNA methyltransferase [Polyangiaceae bacterium]